MSSYNFINGVAATFNPEIREKLKAWGVPFVVSDAFYNEAGCGSAAFG